MGETVRGKLGADGIGMVEPDQGKNQKKGFNKNDSYHIYKSNYRTIY